MFVNGATDMVRGGLCFGPRGITALENDPQEKVVGADDEGKPITRMESLKEASARIFLEMCEYAGSATPEQLKDVEDRILEELVWARWKSLQ
jgi:hypothetical protein